MKPRWDTTGKKRIDYPHIPLNNYCKQKNVCYTNACLKDKGRERKLYYIHLNKGEKVWSIFLPNFQKAVGKMFKEVNKRSNMGTLKAAKTK